jgi:hypothetical protein
MLDVTNRGRIRQQREEKASKKRRDKEIIEYSVK